MLMSSTFNARVLFSAVLPPFVCLKKVALFKSQLQGNPLCQSALLQVEVGLLPLSFH